MSGIILTNFRQLDKDYCDDVQILSNDVQDLVRFDEILQKFTATSGAILSRNKKSNVMGLGSARETKLACWKLIGSRQMKR